MDTIISGKQLRNLQFNHFITDRVSFETNDEFESLLGLKTRKYLVFIFFCR